MVSKSKANFILSLQKKKEREKEKLFVIEGDKIVKEFLMAKIRIRTLIAKPEFINTLPEPLRQYVGETEVASYEELKKISTLKTPHNAMAVVAMSEYNLDKDVLFQSLTLALDFVQDPGNLGTIIRAASWFGIRDIVCSGNCVDVYNPKVIQTSMGAILNVRVHYCDLKEFLASAADKGVPVYGTLLDGESVYKYHLGPKGIILLGNESRGIAIELMPFISDRIRIPGFATSPYGIDSLNVAMAASVVLSEFARRRSDL